MPEKHTFYEHDYLAFDSLMINETFRRITEREFQVELKQANVEPPTPRSGREEGYTFFILGLRVIIWTSYVMREGMTRDYDAGRVLILEGNKIVYMGTFVHRTKYFFERLFIYSLAAKEHICARPECPDCGRLMTIFQQRKGARKCFWVCPNPDHNKKGPTIGWSVGLSDRTLPYLRKKWDRAADYYDSLRAQGKEIGTKRANRRGWKEKNTST